MIFYLHKLSSLNKSRISIDFICFFAVLFKIQNFIKYLFSSLVYMMSWLEVRSANSIFCFSNIKWSFKGILGENSTFQIQFNLICFAESSHHLFLRHPRKLPKIIKKLNPTFDLPEDYSLEWNLASVSIRSVYKIRWISK